MPYYAVAMGKNPGIYNTWNECKAQVDGYSGAKYKKFELLGDAEEFVGMNSRGYNNSRRYNTSSRSYDYQQSNRIFYKGNDQFFQDENGYIEVYTDGACTGNGRFNAMAGIGVWFADNNSYNISRPLNGRATNNRAEITAVTVAAYQARKAGFQSIKIFTDSQFVISCVTQWMQKWKEHNWTRSCGNPVKNKIELMEMEDALAPLEVVWHHVRGHQGNYGNERADQLARAGCEQYVPQ